ncbi:MAG: zinc-binding dehydrogenase [Bacteroides sp.]|nr:zinc-binding dehydrogenase [Bacteroides sp.]
MKQITIILTALFTMTTTSAITACNPDNEPENVQPSTPNPQPEPTPDAEQMANCPKQDMILDTVSAGHDVNVYLNLLKVDGSLVIVGLPNQPLQVGAFNVVNGRKSFSGSNIGGIAETQEVIDFCAKHDIRADIELINIQDVNTAFGRLEKGQVKYRFVIDMASLKK